MVVHEMIKSFLHVMAQINYRLYNQNAMDIMKQPLHPRVWAWLELAIEAGVDGHGPIFASASWEVANCIGSLLSQLRGDLQIYPELLVKFKLA